MANEVMKLVGYGGAVIALATISVTGIAVLEGYKDTNTVDNDTVDKFIAAIAVFGTFMTIIILVVIGKTVMKMLKGEGE